MEVDQKMTLGNPCCSLTRYIERVKAETVTHPPACSIVQIIKWLLTYFYLGSLIWYFFMKNF